MLCNVTQIIQDALLKVFKFEELVTVIISILPIVEARGAIPIAFGYGIKPPLAGLYAFIGSSLMAPILIAVLLPFVKWLAKTKMFRKVGQTLYEKFEKKSQGILKDEAAPSSTNDSGNNSDGETAIADSSLQTENGKSAKKDFKKMLGVFAFVAIPLPLTGVWTGSAVAAFTRLPYLKALISVIAGNLVASSIITLLCFFFQSVIDWIILAIGIIAIVVVLVLIIKIILHKPAAQDSADANKKENN